VSEPTSTEATAPLEAAPAERAAVEPQRYEGTFKSYCRELEGLTVDVDRCTQAIALAAAVALDDMHTRAIEGAREVVDVEHGLLEELARLVDHWRTVSSRVRELVAMNPTVKPDAPAAGESERT